MTSAERPPGRPALDRRARILLPVLIVLLALVSVYRYTREPPRSVHVFQGEALGTTFSVKLAEAEVAPEHDVGGVVSKALERVDAAMSDWRPDSELSRFNAHTSTQPFPVSEETLAVFAVAQEVAERSAGALDVTVAPLVAIWGFGARAQEGPPTPAAIEALRAHVGYESLVVDRQAGTLRKRDPDLTCDLSAVAKGFAVDRVAGALDALGFQRYLVEVGGELRARGTHLDGGPWRVAIETPDAPGRQIHRIVELRDAAMATSGDYRAYYEVDGRRLSHTIDPRTGRPIEHGLASVTVVASDAAHADALATALNVLGPEAGYAMARSQGIAAYFIVRAEGFEIRATPGFESLLVPEPSSP
jgi:thiamine biosynthesis lipoprotein